MSIMRLDKFFSSQNLATRKEVKSLIKEGMVSVNGSTKLKPEQKVDSEADRICLNGEPVSYKKYIYLMLNKPQGVVSATTDRDCKTVLDLVPEELYRPGLFPAGRLDKDTTGFVLLTDDGELAHQILAPKNHIDKTYHARIAGDITEKEILQFEQGVVLKDGFVCLPAKIKVLEKGEESLVEIVLQEGKYHQIKRMIAAVGGRVTALKRVKMGGLELDTSLLEGGCREILHKDVERFLLSKNGNSLEK